VHDSISFVLSLKLFFSISAQKSRVKPQIHLNRSNKTRSTWRMSSPHPAIIEIETKKPRSIRGFCHLERRYLVKPFDWTNLAITLLQ
jgi:hypothetical protein